ncbi:MAG TPA: dihydrodipicolinate synthase family protein, partial [Myxococcota bacterium]|nr:dihydrodipicolinate synthase family protein [Myxococcota bacterium]
KNPTERAFPQSSGSAEGPSDVTITAPGHTAHAGAAPASAPAWTSPAWTWPDALAGVVPPLISPLTEAGEPDAGALRALVEHILAGGGTGLFVLGGCGEGAWLTLAQRAAVVRAAVAASARRAPVLAGCMLPATGPAIEAARSAADAGAAALVVGSPYYFAVDAPAQRRHVEAILDAVPLPVLLYNIPPATHHVLSPELVASLAAEPRVLGIKDSAGDLKAFQAFTRIKRARPDFRVLQGHEAVMGASLLCGGDGLVPGLGNVAPALFAALIRAARGAELERVAALQEQIDSLGALHAVEHWLPALKAAAAHVGIGTGMPSLPLQPLSPESRARVAALVDRYAPGVESRD